MRPAAASIHTAQAQKGGHAATGNLITRSFEDFARNTGNVVAWAGERRRYVTEALTAPLEALDEMVSEFRWAGVPVFIVLVVFVLGIWGVSRMAAEHAQQWGHYAGWGTGQGGLPRIWVWGFAVLGFVCLWPTAVIWLLGSIIIPTVVAVPVGLMVVGYGGGQVVVVFVKLLAVLPLFLLFLGTRASLLCQGFFFTCQSRQCAHRVRKLLALPVYLCPRCGADNRNLWPSLQGVLSHPCEQCGRPLPTLGALGRARLRCKCARCGEELTRGQAREVLIAIEGPVSSGKTCYLAMAAHEISRAGANRWWLQARFEVDEERRALQEAHLELMRGLPLPATGAVPRATQFLGSVGKGWRKRRIKLYLYDHPGEEVRSELLLGQMQKYMHVLDGFIVIADPEHGLGEEFGRFIQHLIYWAEKNIVRDSDGRMDRRLAVVLSKADLPLVCEKIGDIRKGPIPGERVKAALRDWGHGNSLALLEANFRHVEYFACSALGRSLGPEGSGEVRSYGVLDPIMWILTGKR